MNRFVTPENFKEKFLSVCRNENANKSLLENWEYANIYSEMMLGGERKNGILKIIADNLELKYLREYWTLDAIMFRERDEKHFKDGSNFAKYIEVALEHENIARSAYNEINKLNIIQAYTKVLVTYPTSSDDGDYLLKEFAEIVKSGDIFNKCGIDFDQIVIFAPYKKPVKIEWEFYKYKNAEFIKF